MRRVLIFIIITTVLLAMVGCSSRNFMVYKNGANFYITSACQDLKRVLCDSGDMAKIAKDSNLSSLLQMELEDGICASGKVKKYLMDILVRMTKEQHAALKEAFIRNGYEINRPVDS